MSVKTLGFPDSGRVRAPSTRPIAPIDLTVGPWDEERGVLAPLTMLAHPHPRNTLESSEKCQKKLDRQWSHQ